MIYLPPIIENDISYKISNIIVRNGSFGLTVVFLLVELTIQM